MSKRKETTDERRSRLINQFKRVVGPYARPKRPVRKGTHHNKQKRHG